jgi:ABC-2 type transport system permease protein
MLATFRAEMAKQWRRPRTFVVLGLTAFVPVLVTVLLELNPPDDPRSSGTFLFLSTTSGLLLPVAALRLMSRFLLVIVIALFAGDAIAAEASWGNLRALLVRPVGRGRLLASKAASAAVLATIATASIPVVGLIAGGLAFGWRPLDLPLGILGLDALHLSEGELVLRLFLASAYVLWNLAIIGAFSFMLSTMTDSPVGASFAGVGLYVLSQILEGIDSLGSVREGLPTRYLDEWASLFRPGGADPDMVWGLVVPLAYVVVFGAVAWWWFRRKDVLS